MSRPFFFRIESADLLDFATDPAGEGMSLLRFAKELQKGKSEIEFIQSIIDETHNYMEQKRNAGSKGGRAKASGAIAMLESAIAKPSAPLARSSTETETETETETKPRATRRFAPPTHAELKSYCLERKNQIDQERFVDHYTSNGWLVGKNKMKDWKAAVRNWEKGDSKNGNSKSNGKLDIPTGEIDWDEGF